MTLRISNIYDLSSRIFLFKCAKPGSKAQLLVDSGFRCHLTSFTRTAASAPSQFVSRLRKYLKSRRITGVSQIGTDRVIEITFSDGQYRLFLEFFAAGNIILTDAELNVIALLRQVSEGNEDVDVKLGAKYVLDAKQNFHGIPAVSQERIKESIERQAAKFKEAQDVGGKKAKRHKRGDDLRKALSIGFPEFPPHLLEHAFTEAGLDPTTKLQDALENEIILQQVETAMHTAGKVFQSLDTPSQHKGYIIATIKPSSAETSADNGEHAAQQEHLLYDDFHPFRPAQVSEKPGTRTIEFDGFNKTVDEFYSSLESQKLESRLNEREEAAKKKLETAKLEHQKRLAGLQNVQEMHIRKAEAIEANTHRVEEAVAAINGLIAQGMDWVDIGRLIENEQKRNNPVAQMLKLPLKLHENTVTLLLDEPGIADYSDEEDADATDKEAESDDEVKSPKHATTEKRLAIDIDLALSPYANARQYYDQKKSAAQKEQKTVAASEKALKSMQKKTEIDLKKSLKQEKATLKPTRKQFWFEKFLFFISSDGYLVLGGKDAQQNELLYRRYLKNGDIYVHADLHGASSVIVKNNPSTPDAPVPPSTLSQAGALSVCSSSAWDSKAVMAAWWVKADQVSKTAPTGEYLTTGGFIIRGQKNFLPPSQLLLGFACYWLISEESRANHGKHRLARTESMLSGEAEVLEADARGLSIEDDEHEEGGEELDVVPDIEDTGHEGLKEMEEDEKAAESHVEDNEDENAEEIDDERAQRSNPLQNNSARLRPEIDSDMESSGHHIESGDEEDKGDGVENIDQSSQTLKDEPAHEVVDDSNNVDESEDDVLKDSDQPTIEKPIDSATRSNQNAPKVKSAQPKRGANTKAAKRRAAKYALQDEEDKALAMELLGSNKAQQHKQAEEEARAAREAKLAADKERRKAQHLKAAEAEKTRQERLERQLAKGDDIGEADEEEDAGEEDARMRAEEERKEHMNIDLLVPYPEPGDELISAVPVVAPWTALARCKYKVKLQPGNIKKGKAVKEIVGTWAGLASRGPKVVDESNKDKDKVWSREIGLVKGWRMEEIVGAVPVKGVRIVQGGGLAGQGNAGTGSGGAKGKGASGAKGGKGGKKGR